MTVEGAGQLRYGRAGKPDADFVAGAASATPGRGRWGRTLVQFSAVRGGAAMSGAAGRLDRDSEGLLLLTDDGRLQARIADPRYKLAKTYWVQVEGEPDAAAIAALRARIQKAEIDSEIVTLDRLEAAAPGRPDAGDFATLAAANLDAYAHKAELTVSFETVISRISPAVEK